MATVKFENEKITDGTYTMKPDIYGISGTNKVTVTVFGEGWTDPKIATAVVEKIAARLIEEVFPLYVAYKQETDQREAMRLHTQLDNLGLKIASEIK